MILKKTFDWACISPSIISGILLALSFPGANLSWLAYIALVPLLLSLKARSETMNPGQAFYAGAGTGLIFFLTLLYWIVNTVHQYGQLHVLLAVSILVLLCVYLCLYTGIFTLVIQWMYADRRFKKNIFLVPFSASFLWVGLEYVRTYAFTGFSWGSLGYSQYKNPALIQIVDLTGVYGVSFMIVLVNFAVSDILGMIRSRAMDKNLISVFITGFIFFSVVFYGTGQKNKIDGLNKKSPAAVVSIVQGNIRQEVKWSWDFKFKTVEKYVRLSNSLTGEKPDLVIWPETSLPFYYGLEPDLSAMVQNCIREMDTDFLIGSPAFEKKEKTAEGRAPEINFYNRAYMFNRHGEVSGNWDKYHLVPFGEYVPFGKYLTFLGKITAQAGNFSPGQKKFAPLEFTENTTGQIHKTGVLICFEILFPGIASRFVKNDADLLTTLTNDAWFGKSSAAMQHFSISVFRAVENRRTLVRAANTGISGFISPAGEILETTPVFEDRVLSLSVPLLNYQSFYSKHGDLFAICSILLFFAVTILGIKKPGYTSRYEILGSDNFKKSKD